MKRRNFHRIVSVSAVAFLALIMLLHGNVVHASISEPLKMVTITNRPQSQVLLGTRAIHVPGQSAPLLRALRSSPGGGFQVSDESLTNEPEPAMWSATENSVAISWTPLLGATGYLVFKDGALKAQTISTSWIDGTVKPGEIHNYVISTVFSDQSESGGIWGFPVTIPAASTQNFRSATKAYRAQAALVTALTSATVQYQTFIPSATVNAPSVGCSYGSGYKFGGDNRSFLASGYPYRTKIQAQAGFTGSGTVTLQAATVGKTAVYNSAGTLVNSATASASGLTASRLGASTGSVVDMRVSLAASNPFCPVGNSIQGAFTISVSKTGAWVISSGSHKQMPNHEIYVHSNVGGWVTAYTRTFADPICLVNLACPSASIVGSGTY